MSTVTLARQSEREELLELLLANGILRRSETQPVLSRDGASARWMLDSLPVTLTLRGAELAGRLVLERLRSFDGRQLATYGLTAVPILQSVILQAGGAYHGLLVRKERKAHGSQKLIEGNVDSAEPTIMIEDSIASGSNVKEGISKLVAAGLRVEGCVTLVRFGWEGGCSDLDEQGYHVEAVYDIFEDFMSRMEGEDGPDYNPTKCFQNLVWSERRATDGLHPAHLAREVVREYLIRGEVLRPPSRLDRDGYDSSGGAWVSVRSRDDIFERHARDGFWHFPAERSSGITEDLVRAAFTTACELPRGPDGLKLLDSSCVAVTFFSALERATVGEIDNNRYGIVVVSGERPEIMGGALPRMPGIRDEWQQFRHARYNNAGLYAFEPYVLYRHEVAKFVEPGAVWPSSGVALEDDSANFSAIAQWARELVLGNKNAGPFPGFAHPATAAQLFVTIYIDGQVRGCAGSDVDDLENELGHLIQAALNDERFEEIPLDGESEIAISISVLHNELEMGDFSPREVRLRFCHGQQALALEQNTRQGLLLPFVSSWLSVDAEGFVEEVIDKAGVTRPPYNWRRFDCVTWLADQDGTWILEGGFKRTPPTLDPHQIARLQLEYLLRNQRKDGSLYFSYHPFENVLCQGIDPARLAHAAWILARAGQIEAARSALKYLRDQAEDEALALSRDAFQLLAVCEPGMAADAIDPQALARKLLGTIDCHGRIATWTPMPPSAESDEEFEGTDPEVEEEDATIDPEELQNYVPGQVLLALAAASRAGLLAADERQVERALRYYRHRFRYKRDFGQVSWMTLACSAWARFANKSEWAAFVFEIADWILEFQQLKTGAFVTDHQPDTPGYTTAVYLEAIAAAVHVSAAFEGARKARYEDAWQRGFAFLDRLIIQQRDSSVLPNIDYAVGGLRENLYSGHVRIDFVQHSLAAILERYPDLSCNYTNRLGES